MDLGLRDKVCIVAAASQGLGRACAEALAREGARVVICSRSIEKIERTAKEIAAATGASVVPVAADVARAVDIRRVVETAKLKFGTVHVLVNNAGGPPVGDILKLSDEEWQRGFELTLMSVVRMTREVLPMMREQKWGRIITITSYVAKQPLNELILSTTIRPGIHGLTKILSNLHASANITVNAVCPGNVATARQQELAESRGKARGISKEEYFAEAAKEIPTGRFGRTEEVGEVVAFLASERASYINGVNLLVDGGVSKGLF